VAKEKDGQKERLRVDFNRLIRSRSGESYRTPGGLPLRLGKVAVDGIEAAGGARGSTLESDDKRRLDDLASKIVNCKLDGSVEEAPFNVLILPRRVVDQLDKHISTAGFVTGVYAAAYRLLYGDEAKVLSFDDIEVEDPGEIEADTNPTPEVIP
jgi:hypothetical protein